MTYGACSPDAARSLAQALPGHADQVHAVASRVASVVDAMTFRGPAADRLRATTAGGLATTTAIAEALRCLAAHLLVVAVQVEEAQRQEQLARDLGATDPTV